MSLLQNLDLGELYMEPCRMPCGQMGGKDSTEDWSRIW